MYLLLFAGAVAHVPASRVSSARPALDPDRGTGLSLQEQVVQDILAGPWHQGILENGIPLDWNDDTHPADNRPFDSA